jgi:DeoR family transcriptional regulator, aga operon transcriptional repressor
MRKADRLKAILELLATDGTLDVSELTERFDVSDATVRRDLQDLELQKLLSRTHGGAVAHGLSYELPLRYKTARRHDEKVRIARIAAEQVTDGMVVGLTGGTTTTEIARQLSSRQKLTIVTNALNIAFEMVVRPDLKLVVTGGVARTESYELVGPLAESTLVDINLDLVFVGADGISLEAGLTTHHEVEAHTNRALIDRSHRIVAVADSSKIGRTAFARICEIGKVDELITDSAAEPSIVATLQDAGIQATRA